MNPTTIDRYLDECGITPGPWSDVGGVIFGDINNGNLDGDHPLVTHMPTYRPYYQKETGKLYPIEDSCVIAASREMLKALIFSGIIMEDEKTATDFPLEETFSGKIIIDSIQKALPGRTWTEIKKRLEELDAV